MSDNPSNHDAVFAVVGLALILVGGEIAHSGLGMLGVGVALFAGSVWS